MLRALLLSLPLLAGLAQAAPQTIAQPAVSLDSGQGRLYGTLVQTRSGQVPASR